MAQNYTFLGSRLNSTFHTLPAMSRSKTNDQVQHGQWRKDSNDAKLDVTLKSVDFADSEAEVETNKTKLLQEAAIMRQFRHPNILRLYGVVNEDRVSEIISTSTVHVCVCVRACVRACMRVCVCV